MGSPLGWPPSSATSGATGATSSPTAIGAWPAGQDSARGPSTKQPAHAASSAWTATLPRNAAAARATRNARLQALSESMPSRAGRAGSALSRCPRSYRHNPQDFASDSVYTKVVARRMLEMTRHVNADWKSHVASTGVTCYTCHRGNNIPAATWFQAVDPHPYGMVGNKAGQNAPAIGVARDLNAAYLIPLAATFPATRKGPAGDVAKVNCASCHQGALRSIRARCRRRSNSAPRSCRIVRGAPVCAAARLVAHSRGYRRLGLCEIAGGPIRIPVRFVTLT
ncbi:MAG: photosynthetic reaction center cytochrome c subunit family protein [Burkholderiaceae bacterium]|jgi:hypothetical protein